MSGMKYDFDFGGMTEDNSLFHIVNRIRKNSSVLEFGCANGRMTRYLKENLNCDVRAVEINADAAQHAASFAKELLIADVEELSWLEHFDGYEFDYITFADVLEHLKDPKIILSEAKKLLSSEGSILISIPNIAHNSIIMNLIDDEFDYQEIGLLDKTHIRFFTYKSLLSLFRNVGLEVQYETAVFLPPEKTEFNSSYEDQDIHVESVLRQRAHGEAYQFIFELKKKAISPVREIKNKSLVTIYLDFGDGFSEENTIKKPVFLSDDGVLNIDLDQNLDGVLNIRVDLLERPFEMTLLGVTVNSEDYKNHIQHNGIRVGERVLFDSFDPWMMLDARDMSVCQISIKYSGFKCLSYTDLAFANGLRKEEAARLKEEAARLKYSENQMIDEICRLEDLAQSLRIKNRFKRLFNYFAPGFLKLK